MKFPLPKRNVYLNVPNYISFARVIFIPVIVLLMAFQGPLGSGEFSVALGYFAAFFFVLAGISDLFDGYAARKMGLSSGVFGKFLDPIADKLLHMAVMIMLIPLHELPAWIVILFLAREFSVTALRGIAAGEGVILPADIWGKKKTALLNVALTCFLLPPVFIGASTRPIGWVVIIMALVVSWGSGVNYFFQFFSKIKN